MHYCLHELTNSTPPNSMSVQEWYCSKAGNTRSLCKLALLCYSSSVAGKATGIFKYHWDSHSSSSISETRVLAFSFAFSSIPATRALSEQQFLTRKQYLPNGCGQFIESLQNYNLRAVVAERLLVAKTVGMKSCLVRKGQKTSNVMRSDIFTAIHFWLTKNYDCLLACQDKSSK